MAYQFPPFIKQETITVEDIYGTDDLVYPEGYEPTGEFRIPNSSSDRFLSVNRNYRHIPQVGGESLGYPYIILRKKKIQYTTEQTLNFILDQMRSHTPGSALIDRILELPRPTSESTKHLREMLEATMQEKGIK